MSAKRNILAAVVLSTTLLAASATPAMAGRTFSHRMTGEVEVPVGDLNGAGHFRVELFPRQHMLCYSMWWARIKSPMMAHIHRGRAGVAGPVRVTLFSQVKPLPSEITSVKGCVDGLRTRLLLNIRDNPSRFYVNVHNRPFPAGAIRGQLV
jgi:hypothetical protein